MHKLIDRTEQSIVTATSRQKKSHAADESDPSAEMPIGSPMPLASETAMLRPL